MRKILSIGVILFLITTIGAAYAEIDEVDVPFKFTGKGCFVEEEKFQYHCVWDLIKDPVTGELIVEIPEQPGTEIQAEEEPELELVEPTDQPKPLTSNQRKIIELEERLQEEGSLVSHESQLLRALLSYQDECELGTEEGAPIQTYELFTIATYEPYTHTDLGTQYLLKQIELAIQECKSQEILKEKVLGPQYLHIPGQSDVKQPHEFRSDFEGIELWKDAEGLDDPTYAFAERHMTEFNKDKSKQFAETFKCSKIGKSMGYCRDPFTGAEPLEDVVTMSSQGRQVLSKYQAYQESGITDIPKHEPDAEPDQASIARQYLKAAGYSNEQIDAAIEAMEDENNE